MSLRIRKFVFIVAAVVLLGFSVCTPKRAPNVANIKISWSLLRFEQDLFSLPDSNAAQAVGRLAETYDDFFWFYFDGPTHASLDSTWVAEIVAYKNDTFLRRLNDTVQVYFGQFDSYRLKLHRAFQYVRYYFPEAVIPQVITTINGPSRSAYTYGDSILCINLEDYLGTSSSFYRHLDLPNYLLRKFRPEYLVANCMHVLATSWFPFDMAQGTLLDAMVYQGKIMYFKSLMLPGVADSIITGFRQQDLDWCLTHEPRIWHFFVSRDLLYSQDLLEYMKYVTDGPTTSGMPPEAPGNIGSWCGWRIVNRFMKKHPSLSLRELMELTDAQYILSASGYKPR